MKKFLSLVLALVMTMSLVTISAGAAEYKDLTDKDEITYEEAVAVLNRIGIITGYSDGSFQPTKELTRGAAAKIIVSLMIGSEAASNLVAASAPYTDVPVNHTFAGVISYCKTAGYINGYSDGSFKPDGTLSGYAFSKMLLGALGYKGEYENGFTGAGWTMNVARLGNSAGLFDRLTFKGNEPVNREQACQLALNTLKGTLVEYTGGLTISSGEATITGGATRSYITSNQEFAQHINNRKAGGQQGTYDDWYTVEFGEEHFVDLRMKQERSVRDDFGRPSNEWSYKKVTIGTYPAEADFTYTAQVAHDVTTVTDASKVRALGLDGYKVDTDGRDNNDTQLHMNGVDTNYAGTVADIADYTDNGTLVEVYVSDTEADLITDIVVVRTQLMEVKRVGSDDVTLDKISPDNKDIAAKTTGYNQEPLHVDVIKVEVDNDNFEFLKGLKAGDEVAVVPVEKSTSSEFEVFKAYTPEEVEGKLTKANTYGNVDGRQTVAVTVGGTEYKAALWNKKIVGIDDNSIKYTKGDVKLKLDEYGYALKASGVGETEDFIVIKDTYQSLENGKLVTYVEGWDIKGNELSLNIGTAWDGAKYKAGDLVEYINVGAKDPADWLLKDRTDGGQVWEVKTADSYEIKASNVRVADSTNTTHYITNDVKFIYVTFDGTDVDGIEIKDGVQNVKNTDIAEKGGTNHYRAQLCLNDDGEVEAVVIKKASDSAVSTSLLYIRDWDGGYSLDSNGKRVYQYTVARMSKDGFEPNETIWADRKLNQGAFASYSASTNEGFEPFYKLKEQTGAKKTTSVIGAKVFTVVHKDKGIVRLTDYTSATFLNDPAKSAGLGVGDETNAVSMIRAEWLDLTGNSINSVGDLKDFTDAHRYPEIQMIFNDNPDNDGFRTASLVVITNISGSATEPTTVLDPVTPPAAGGYTPALEELDAENAADPAIKVTGEPSPSDKKTPTQVKIKAGMTDANPVEAYAARALPDNSEVDPDDPKALIFTCTVGNGRLTVNADGSFVAALKKSDVDFVKTLGTGALIVNLVAVTVEQKVTVTAPTDWTVESPVNVTSGSATVTLTYKENGELTPAKKITITPPSGANWTATGSFSNGTADTKATFSISVTVTGEDSAVIPASALVITDVTPTPEPTCTCSTKCTVGHIDSTCDVCKNLTNDFTACEGEEAQAPTTFDVTVAAPTGGNWTASTAKLTGVDATTGKTYTLTSKTLGAKDYTVTAASVDGLTITSAVAPGKAWTITQTAVDLSSANDLAAKKTALKAAISGSVVGLVTDKTNGSTVLDADAIDALTDQTIGTEYYPCTQEATATVITVTVKATKAAAIAADTLTITEKVV